MDEAQRRAGLKVFQDEINAAVTKYVESAGDDFHERGRALVDVAEIFVVAGTMFKSMVPMITEMVDEL